LHLGWVELFWGAEARFRRKTILGSTEISMRNAASFSPILDDLNQAQREAVQHGDGPMLVLAGPGSGKTRVLTHRVAYLVRERGVWPYRILAVTFTNKAAREMRSRLYNLLGEEIHWLTIGTFHATCARLLRREANHIGFSSSFVIFDEEDTLTLLTQVVKELNLDDKKYRPPGLRVAISRAKNELLTLTGWEPRTYWEEIALRVYERYQTRLAEQNAMDFDDLLTHTVRLFQEQPEVLQRYQERYHHLLVDEWQDTNMAQYEIIRLLAGKRRNVFVVGDEDQSIYSWRGANFRNVQRFREDFPEARVILLEQNYRSTQTVLDAAQAVIQHNVHRTKKNLWTDKGPGPRITIYEAYNEEEEGSYVVEEIQRLVREGLARAGDCAIMYRTNAQSRAIEEAFIRRGLPYRLVGATRFYQRREIKDVIAYLRLIHNPEDLVSLERIINVPPRDIGKSTIASLWMWAAAMEVSPYKALSMLRENNSPMQPPFGSRASRSLLAFLTLLDNLQEASTRLPLPELLDQVLERTGYKNYLCDGTEEGEERWGNVMELRSVAAQYASLSPEEALPTFLEDVALVSDVDNLEENVDAPTLLTLHMAKGLEFPVVFITGLEEGLFPHSRSFDNPDQMEEERRLCYVGITRAKERLYLLHAFRRSIWDNDEIRVPSRFIEDIPARLVTGPPVRKIRSSSWRRSRRWK